jgi:hypothetical protein
MAKGSKKVVEVGSDVNRAMLAQIASGFIKYVNKDEALSAGLNHNPPLVEVNTGAPNPEDASRVMVRITEAGAAYLTQAANPVNEPVKEVERTVSNFALMTGVVLPPSKRGTGLRGGAGAPKKYPFDEMEIGHTFFVPVSTTHPDPVKTLGSTVSSANMRFAEETGETKTVERSKRGKGNKLELDANGNKIVETKTVPVYKFTRKFEIRGVEKGKTYGNWTADSDGALIARTA